MFNSVPAIRNTLTSGFDGDVKGVWKPLSVERPLCSHSHLHKRHRHAHGSLPSAALWAMFIKSTFHLFKPDSSSFFHRSLHKTLTSDYSVRELWITTLLSALSQTDGVQEVVETERKRTPASQRDNQLGNLFSSLDSLVRDCAETTLCVFMEAK